MSVDHFTGEGESQPLFFKTLFQGQQHGIADFPQLAPNILYLGSTAEVTEYRSPRTPPSTTAASRAQGFPVFLPLLTDWKTASQVFKEQFYKNIF